MNVTYFCVMASPERVAAKKCLAVIPEERAKRGCHFCSSTCHDEYRKQRRAQLAERRCRLCGRPKRKPKAREVGRDERSKI